MIIPALSKIHGFDGLFLCPNNNLIIYESKFAEKSSYSNLSYSARNTIENLKWGRVSETQIGAKTISVGLEIGKINFYEPDGNVDNKFTEISPDENLKKSLEILSNLSKLLANEKTTKLEYEQMFSKLINSENYALFLGSKIKSNGYSPNKFFDTLELFEYAENFDGKN